MTWIELVTWAQAFWSGWGWASVPAAFVATMLTIVYLQNLLVTTQCRLAKAEAEVDEVKQQLLRELKARNLSSAAAEKAARSAGCDREAFEAINDRLENLLFLADTQLQFTQEIRDKTAALKPAPGMYCALPEQQTPGMVNPEAGISAGLGVEKF